MATTINKGPELVTVPPPPTTLHLGFCQVKKNPKILEKLESGWMGILFFCVMFMFLKVAKKIKIGWGGVWILSDQTEFLSDFWIFF